MYGIRMRKPTELFGGFRRLYSQVCSQSHQRSSRAFPAKALIILDSGGITTSRGFVHSAVVCDPSAMSQFCRSTSRCSTTALARRFYDAGACSPPCRSITSNSARPRLSAKPWAAKAHSFTVSDLGPVVP
jgi:hypothetical protein